MLKDIGDILISKRVVDRNGCDIVEAAGQIDGRPLGPILREYSDEPDILALGLAEQILVNDSTANSLSCA